MILSYNADTPELEGVDDEMEDAGDEGDETNFMADIEVLDSLYLRETIESSNQKVQDVVLYWMKSTQIAFLLSTASMMPFGYAMQMK